MPFNVSENNTFADKFRHTKSRSIVSKISANINYWHSNPYLSYCEVDMDKISITALFSHV